MDVYYMHGEFAYNIFWSGWNEVSFLQLTILYWKVIMVYVDISYIVSFVESR
jgi:hypothetical protein